MAIFGQKLAAKRRKTIQSTKSKKTPGRITILCLCAKFKENLSDGFCSRWRHDADDDADDDDDDDDAGRTPDAT